MTGREVGGFDGRNEARQAECPEREGREIGTIILGAVFIGFPALARWSAGRWKAAEWVSPIVMAYLVGIAIGNLFDVDTDFSTTVSEAMVLLAIPLLLFSTDVRNGFGSPARR